MSWHYEAAPEIDIRQQLFLISPSYHALAATLLGVYDHPAMGVVGALALDCRGDLAPGWSFRVSPQSSNATTWYGRVPDKSMTATSAEGVGGVALIAPGMAEVTAVLAGTEQVPAGLVASLILLMLQLSTLTLKRTF